MGSYRTFVHYVRPLLPRPALLHRRHRQQPCLFRLADLAPFAFAPLLCRGGRRSSWVRIRHGDWPGTPKFSRYVPARGSTTRQRRWSTRPKLDSRSTGPTRRPRSQQQQRRLLSDCSLTNTGVSESPSYECRNVWVERTKSVSC